MLIKNIRELNRMNSAQRKYKITCMSAMKWATHELNAVGRIASIKDVDIQYTYAMCTVNSMLHLRKALMDLSEDPTYTQERASVLQTLDEVERVITHLIKDYNVDLNAIRSFNTRKIMGDISKFNTAPPARVNNQNSTRKRNNTTSSTASTASPVSTQKTNAVPQKSIWSIFG
jgi:hypothetical protein